MLHLAGEALLKARDPHRGVGMGPATPPYKTGLASETETRDTTTPGGEGEGDQVTGLMKDGDQTRWRIS